MITRNPRQVPARAPGRARRQGGPSASHSWQPADAGSVRVVAVGVLVGVVSLLSPFALFWLPHATVYAVSLAVIAGIYIGFAVADGRPHVLAVETVVAAGFILIGAAALNQHSGALWLVATGLLLHGVKDLWQHRTQFVRNTRWWPPFCVAVDWTAALGLAGSAALG